MQLPVSNSNCHQTCFHAWYHLFEGRNWPCSHGGDYQNEVKALVQLDLLRKWYKPWPWPPSLSSHNMWYVPQIIPLLGQDSQLQHGASNKSSRSYSSPRGYWKDHQNGWPPQPNIFPPKKLPPPNRRMRIRDAAWGSTSGPSTCSPSNFSWRNDKSSLFWWPPQRMCNRRPQCHCIIIPTSSRWVYQTAYDHAPWWKG